MFQTNFVFNIIIFSCLHLAVQSQIQPTFLSPVTTWKLSKDSTSGVSPFYQNEKGIIFQIQHLINRGEERKALDLLKLIVKTERSWRLLTCRRMFGVKSCDNSGTGDAVPFFIWKKKMINQLRTDPTAEIINHIQRSVNFSK